MDRLGIIKTEIKAAANSTYKKLAVMCLNEALCPACAGFSADRQFSAS